jgi:hypothetical protein
MSAVTTGGPGLVAVGWEPRGAAVWTSRDGLSWKAAPWQAAFRAGAMGGVARGGPGLEAYGIRSLSGHYETIWESADGVHWRVAPRWPGLRPRITLTDLGYAQQARGVLNVLSADGNRWIPAPDALPVPDPEDAARDFLDKDDQIAATIDAGDWALIVGFSLNQRVLPFMLVRNGTTWHRLEGQPQIRVAYRGTGWDAVQGMTWFRGRLIAVGLAQDLSRPMGWFRIRGRVWVLDPEGVTGTGALPEPHVRCPDAESATLADVLGMHPVDELRCFGTSDLTLRGWIPQPPTEGGTCYAQAEAMDLHCIERILQVYRGPGTEYQGGLSLFQRGPQRDYTTYPDPGWYAVSGHFDDPASSGCQRTEAVDGPRTKAQAVMQCRTRFVVTRFRPARH